MGGGDRGEALVHIPDGYLGPQTYVPLWAAMLAAWSWAGRVVRRRLKSFQVPLLAIGAAFTFVIMMFNVPIPGGTTGHAVGAGLVAIVLGPWAAMIAVSVALIVQALLFGDGGVTAIGANAFTMAVVLPFVSYWTYRLVAGRSEARSRRRPIAAAVAGYVGLNASALATAVLFGIQPMIAHTPGGQPLYAPYPLSVAVPAMAIEHLLVFGFVEAAVTGLAVAYLQRTDVALLEGNMLRPSALLLDTGSAGLSGRTVRRFWIALVVLALLSPIGIVVPAWLRSGAAWGEWSSGQIRAVVGFVPAGMRGLRNVWHALFSGYGVRGLGAGVGYVVSAFIGVLVVAAIMRLLAILFRPQDELAETPPISGPATSAVAAGTSPDTGSIRQPCAIPPWMATPASVDALNAQPARGRRRDYVAKTLQHAGEVVKDALFVERWARMDGTLQRLDPRVKIVAAGLLVVLATVVHHQPVLWSIYVLTLVLAVASRVPLALFMKRVWLFVPIFTGLVVLPATLNIVTPGTPLLVLCRLGGHVGPWALPATLAITRPGVDVATLMVARVAISVSAVVLLTLTTLWTDLLKALRALRVSTIFVMVMEMSYRYVFVLLGMVEETYLAKRARTLRRAPTAVERRWVGSRLGATIQRSRRLTDAVYQAMVARGYSGEPRSLRKMHARRADLGWAIATCALFVLAIGVDKVGIL